MGVAFFAGGIAELGLDSAVLLLCLSSPTSAYAVLCWLAFFRVLLGVQLIRLHIGKKKFGAFRPAFLWLIANMIVAAVKAAEQFILEPEPVVERYTLLGLSTLAIFCQVACVQLLRSSAVSLKTKHVFLRAAVPRQGMERAGGDVEHQGGEGAPLQLQALGTPWDHAMRRMRQRWLEHMDALRDRATDVGLYRGLHTPTHLLVRLYAHSGDSNHDQQLAVLESEYDAEPDVFFPYLPQYTLFLLYGSFGSSEALEKFLLERSRSSVHVAHNVYWFTVAFCLHEAGVSAKGVEAIELFLEKLVTCGEQPALELWQGRGPGEALARGAAANGVADLREFEAGEAQKRSQPYVGTFSAAPSFIDALCQISRDLVAVPREKRAEEMQRRLRLVDEAYLPSMAVYVPVGNWRHRAFRIHWDESFVFSTKDRTPLLVTIEVIDYSRPASGHRRGSSAGALFQWAGDRLRAVSNSVTSLQRSFLPPTSPTSGGMGGQSKSFPNYGSLAEPIVVDDDEELGQWTNHKASRECATHAVDEGDDCSMTGVMWEDEARGRHPHAILTEHSPRHLSKGSSGNSFYGADYDEEDDEDDDEEAGMLPSADGTSGGNGDSSLPSPSVGSPSAGRPKVVFIERWKEKEARIRMSSPLGSHPGWRLLPVIVKSGDATLRQEELASQLIGECAKILRAERVGVWLRPYDIRATSSDSGVIEAIPDTVSLDALKKNVPGFTSLLDFYRDHFGEEGTQGFKKAQLRFARSMAGYSVLCYVLQIKDRHNGNILLTRQGHVIHIDYGFLLASSPGGNIGFESAPFKLTAEMVAVMGGVDSATFNRFRKLCIEAFMALRRHTHRITLLLELSAVGNSHLPCFGGRPREVVDELRQRLMPERNDDAAAEAVNALIKESVENWRTAFYDRYQTLNDIRA